MARTMSGSDKVKLTVFCQFNQQIAVNNYFFTTQPLTFSPPYTDQDVADYFDGIIPPLYCPLMTSQATYYGVSVTTADLAATYAPVYAYAGRTAGLVTGSALPKQTSGLIRRQTATAGKTGRGRVYIPFPGEPDNNPDSTPSTAYVGGLDSLAAVMFNVQPPITPMSGGSVTLEPALIIWGSTGVGLGKPVTGWRSHERWATQRRRGDFGRANSPPF